MDTAVSSRSAQARGADMASENTPAQVSPNKFALVLCTALGSTIGIAPFCLFLEEFHLLWIVTLLAAIGAALGVRKCRSAASFRPGPLEFLFATAGAIRLPAGAAIIAFVVCGAVYGVVLREAFRFEPFRLRLSGRT
jgi:hypothetical protein